MTTLSRPDSPAKPRGVWLRATVRDVAVGARFRFPGCDIDYVSRGNGWYNTPASYSGGPWHKPDAAALVFVPLESAGKGGV